MTVRDEGDLAVNRVQTMNGMLLGTFNADTGIRSFKGIPFAAPPVNNLRWKPPQAPLKWEGIRKADTFGPRAMQLKVFGDMGFRSNGMSEDCLYLNVWTPAGSADEKLPVLVYLYGGGNMAGDGSEPRYDGESIARKGIVAITVNYRLNVFGFFSHPELSRESPEVASGNQGYLDQTAALRWVHENIAAFGGDPERVTIAGESAGSISVSVQMTSPLARGLFAGAIGSSGGAIFPTLAPVTLAEAEKRGIEFCEKVGAKSLADLRELSAETILEATAGMGAQLFSSVVEGYFLDKLPVESLAAGDQAKVPLLVGWNSEEGNARAILGADASTVANFAQALRKLYPERADEAIRSYGVATDDDVHQAATDLASDRFIAYSTWKWADLHCQTSGKPVFRYIFARPRPPMRPEMGDAAPGLAGGVVRGAEARANQAPPARGAVHAADIEYAMGNLSTNEVYDWSADDFKVSELMESYYANFVKLGNPNSPGLPSWPQANQGAKVEIMRVNVESKAEPEPNRERYLFLDGEYSPKSAKRGAVKSEVNRK